MIQRHLLTFPEEIPNMDFFNDAGDTVRWLESLQQSEATRKAIKLIQHHRKLWWSQYLEKLKS